MTTILLKDLRENSFAIMVVVVSGLIYLGYRLGRALTFGLSLSEAWTDYVLFGLTPCVLLVAQRLLQREVQHGWPLLQQHPVRLGRLYVGKLVLGGLLVVLPLGIGSLLNRGAQALQTLGGPPNYDPLPGGTGIYLGLVAGLAALASVLGRHAWTAALGLWVLLPRVAPTADAHPLRLIESNLALDATPPGAWGVVAALLVAAGVAFAGFGGRGPAAWRGRWTWLDRGAFCVVALIALEAVPTSRPAAPLRGDVLERPGLCVRDLRRAPEASARIAALSSRALSRLPAGLTLPEVAIEHGGGARLEVSASGGVLLARVDFLADVDPEGFQRDLLYGVLDRVRPRGRAGWAFLRDGFPGWALAGGERARFPEDAQRRAALACATLAAEGLLTEGWTVRWQGEARRRLGDVAAREVAAWLLLRAAPRSLPALVARWGEPLGMVWGEGGFSTDLAGFEADALSAGGVEDATPFRAPTWSLDAERYLTVTPQEVQGTLVVYTARCLDPREVPRVFDRYEGAASLDPWRAGPLPSGRQWVGFAHRRAEGERFAGWHVVEVP
ncbi:MAG: hypothetical protein KDD82_08795 [Planctomycetes bacterium]|nr:hypothetical protein [Planctomycetota bacterium]